MKRLCLYRLHILLLLGVFIFQACSGPRLPEREAPHPFEVPWDDWSLFKEVLIPSEWSNLDITRGATIYHMTFAIADDYLSLSGQQQVRYTNRERVPLSELIFRLFPNISGGNAAVSNLVVEGQTTDLALEAQDSTLRVALAQPLPPGESAVISMDFEVGLTEEMGGNYGLFGYFEEILVLDTFYPMIPAYDADGWYREKPATKGDNTNNDAAFYLVRVEAPEKLVLAAAGSEIGRTYENRRQVVTFAAGPARDFYLAASEEFEKVSRTAGNTVINVYAGDERAEHRDLALNFATSALSTFNERFGPYPYTEFDVVSTPMDASGIEYPGIVGISTDLFDPDAVIDGLPSAILLDSVVAHETAHEWFYNIVGSDQIDEPWLDEAMAQYATGLYYEDSYSPEAAASYRQSWEDFWARSDRVELPIGLSAGDYPPEDYAPVVYGRGPLFVSALNETVGDEKFDSFLQRYVQEYHWRIATASDYRQLAEEVCQCDLGEIFTAWVYE